MDRETLTQLIVNLETAYPGQDMQLLRRQSFGFCNSLFRTNWFVNPAEMLSAEGGTNSMAYNAMLETLTIGDAPLGFQSYLSHLQRMYGNNSLENKNVSLDNIIDRADSEFPMAAALLNKLSAGNTEESGDLPAPLGSGSPAALLVSTLNAVILATGTTRGATGRLRYNEQELDFLDTLASVGSVVEASDFVGLTYKRARMVLANLRRTIKRWSLAAPNLPTM